MNIGHRSWRPGSEDAQGLDEEKRVVEGSGGGIWNIVLVVESPPMYGDLLASEVAVQS